MPPSRDLPPRGSLLSRLGDGLVLLVLVTTALGFVWATRALEPLVAWSAGISTELVVLAVGYGLGSACFIGGRILAAWLVAGRGVAFALAGPAGAAAGLAVAWCLAAALPEVQLARALAGCVALWCFLLVLSLVPFRYQHTRRHPLVRSDGRVIADVLRTRRAG